MEFDEHGRVRLNTADSKRVERVHELNSTIEILNLFSNYSDSDFATFTATPESYAKI